MITLEEGQNPFFGQNWTQNSQNCPKSISREPLVIESWLIHENDHKT